MRDVSVTARSPLREGWRGSAARVLLVLAVLLGARAAPAQEPGNVIKSIKSVAAMASAATRSAPGVEIEVASVREFPVRDEITVLRIGAKEFTLSRSPSDGSLKTLFFSLTAAEFASVKSGETVLVYYGSYDPKASEVWNFGPLDKSLFKTTK